MNLLGHGNLESILRDPSAKPHALRLQELKEITGNFSKDRQLEKGGFGIVYKGLLPNGEAVAVKDLIMSQFQGKQFKREVDNLMKVQHENIVWFLGYCYKSSHQYIEYEATHVFAESPKMLLCFEYVADRSLDKYINDESYGLDWHKRYGIIEGICHGLHYLHEECQPHGSVIHLDLKPENILLDDSMVPKIADFGISKFFGDQKLETHATNAIGSLGYMAPEYISGNIVSKKADIYSLGVVIMQIITGRRIDVTCCEHIVEPALENWRKRMEAKTSTMDCEQIRTCLEISVRCMAFRKEDRPSIKKILELLYSWKDKNNGYTSDKETYKEVEAVREETAEEMVARVGGMVPAALDAARAAAGFPGRWEAIVVNLEKRWACLPILSSHLGHLEPYDNALCRETLQSVADTLPRATDLAGRCRAPLTEGKLHMRNSIDAVAVKLDANLGDCELLFKIGELYDDTSSSAPLVDATSSSCVDVRELQRLLAWLQMSHTHKEAKDLALDGLLEALQKDEKSVVSVLHNDDSDSAMVHLFTASSWPEVTSREKVDAVVCHVVGSNRWLLELEVVVPQLIALAEWGSVVGRQKAAVALHHLSSTSYIAVQAIVSHGGLGPLVEMCRPERGHSVCQSAAVGTLKNISASAPEFRQALADHGIVRVVVGLLGRGGASLPESKKHAAQCLESLTTGYDNDGLPRSVLWEGGLRSLLLYLNDNNNDRHEAAAVNAIRNLVRVISTRNDSAGDTTMKQRLVREQGCLPLLVQIMLEHESKDAREVAVETLASLTTYPPNAREMSSEDDKCVPALVHLLDPNPDNTSTNEYAIQCLLSLASTNKRCRKLMISHGVEGHLRRLSDLNVQGATELLHRLEGGRIRSLFGIRKQ